MADPTDDEVWSVADLFVDRFHMKGITKYRFASIRRLLRKLPVDEAQEAMRIACDRYDLGGRDVTFRYFCGICWRLIREKDQ